MPRLSTGLRKNGLVRKCTVRHYLSSAIDIIVRVSKDME